MSTSAFVPARDRRALTRTVHTRPASVGSSRAAQWTVGTPEQRAAAQDLVRQLLVEGPDDPALAQLRVPMGWRPGLVPSLFARVPEGWRESVMAAAFAVFALVVGPLGMIAAVTGHGRGVLILLGLIVPALFIPLPALRPAISRWRQHTAAHSS